MVPKKKTEEKPAKVLEVLSKEPEHFYHGIFDGLPIAPEEAPQNVGNNFPSKEDVEFDGKDLSYLEGLSKGKELISPRTDHARSLFISLYSCGWTKYPIKHGFGIKVPIDFSFIEGCRYLTAYYQWHLPLISKEDVPPKTKVYQLLNKLDRHTHSLLKELEAENERVYHIEDGELAFTKEELTITLEELESRLESGKLKKGLLKNRKYIREIKRAKILEDFLLKEREPHGYSWNQGVPEEDEQLVSRLLKDLKSFRKYIKVKKEEIDREGLERGRPSDPYAISTLAGIVELFKDFKMEYPAWNKSEDARWNRAGIRLEEFQSDLFKVVSIIFKAAGSPRLYINNIWKAYQERSVPHPRYPFT